MTTKNLAIVFDTNRKSFFLMETSDFRYTNEKFGYQKIGVVHKFKKELYIAANGFKAFKVTTLENRIFEVFNADYSAKEILTKN